jgi:hypothetical protein
MHCSWICNVAHDKDPDLILYLIADLDPDLGCQLMRIRIQVRNCFTKR